MSTAWKPQDPKDPFYDEYQEERDKQHWIEQHFDVLMVPSARGGLERVDDPPSYYSGGAVRTDGFRDCKECFAAVRVDGFYDIDQLSGHREFHDNLGSRS